MHDVTKDVVVDAFNRCLGGTCVLRTDIISKIDRQSVKYNTVFVHFTQWPDNPISREIEDKIINGDTVKIHYNGDKWFWKCKLNNLPEPTSLRCNTEKSYGIAIPVATNHSTVPLQGMIDSTEFGGGDTAGDIQSPSGRGESFDSSTETTPGGTKRSIIDVFNETSRRQGITNKPAWMR